MMQTISLDAVDFRLLDALQADGRLTNQQLAERVGLSASQCSRRRMRLEENGIIRGYRADLAAEPLGFQVLVFVQVALSAHSPDNARRFRDLVARTEEIQEAYSLTGETDYLLKMVLPDLRSLADIVSNTLLAHVSVAHVRSSVVLDRLKETARLPLKREPK
jgi:DNA-binding Lrp family transcriptional regulator